MTPWKVVRIWKVNERSPKRWGQEFEPNGKLRQEAEEIMKVVFGECGKPRSGKLYELEREMKKMKGGRGEGRNVRCVK